MLPPSSGWCGRDGKQRTIYHIHFLICFFNDVYYNIRVLRRTIVSEVFKLSPLWLVTCCESLVLTSQTWDARWFHGAYLEHEKTYQLLNLSPRRDVLGSGGVSPCILNPGAGLRWVVTFTPGPLGLRAPVNHWIAGWVARRAGLDTVGKRKCPIIAPARNW